MTDFQRAVEMIKERLDIVALVSERVPLKRRGRNWVGLCPFHTEKTPSFTVSPEKQMFYCFGCGAGGDAITFWMKIENLDFSDAVKDLADRLGIALPEKTSRGPSKWEAYHEINQAAKDYFHRILLDSKRGRAAFEYLKARGLSLETIKTFELGYAPPSYGLKEVFEKRGLSPQDAVPIGLLKKTDDETYVPVFRRRVIFPILDERGRVVGFGGRALGDHLPKYLNTPDSLIFQKGKLFYGEAQSKREISRQRSAILVEGYLDLLALHQLGIKNGLAALGTAFTDFHANRLKRWADKVVMLFDGDAAGFKASERALEKLTRAGLRTFQGVMPPGKDPGDYLKNTSSDALKEVVEQAEDAILFRIRRASQRPQGQEGMPEQERRIKESLRFLSLISDAVRLNLYVEKAESLLGLNKQILYDIIKNSNGNRNAFKPESVSEKAGLGRGRRARHPNLPGKRLEEPEEVVLTALLQYPQLIEEAIAEDVISLFEAPVHRSLAEAVLESWGDQGEGGASGFVERLGEKEKALFSRLMVGEIQMTEKQARKALSDGIKNLRARRYRAEVAALDTEIREMEASGKAREAMALQKRREAVKRLYVQVLNSN